ncbi:TPA: hypothetical protein GXZ54_07165 [bacterium]|nr:hypothetical protein [bacterium]
MYVTEENYVHNPNLNDLRVFQGGFGRPYGRRVFFRPRPRPFFPGFYPIFPWWFTPRPRYYYPWWF